MSQSKPSSVCRRCRRAAMAIMFCGLALGVVAGSPAIVRSGDVKSGEEKSRVVVGKSISPTAMILRREQPNKPWQVVADQEALYSGDVLLGLPGAVLQSKNGAVSRTL